MNIHTPSLLVLFLVSSAARAEDLCKSRAEIHQTARYCYQNWDFIEPARTCVQEFSDLVSAEFPRLQKMLNERIQAAKSNNAQHLDFHTNDQILHDSLDEVNYLLDYGKQVHTELEDYEYSLDLPVYDDSEAGDPGTNPELRALFMQRECYADPVQLLEGMEARMRPWIDELEKTKAQLVAMSGTTEHRDVNLDGKGRNLSTSHSAGAGKGVPSGTSPRHESTITGDTDKDKLPPK